MLSDPFDCLHMILSKMRGESLQTLFPEDNHYSVENFRSTPIFKLFETQAVMEVSCPVCGVYLEKKYFLSVDVVDLVKSNIQETILHCVYRSTRKACLKCSRMPAVSRPTEVKLPSNLIFHSRSVCGDTFRFQPSIQLKDEKFNFQSCCLQVSEEGQLWPSHVSIVIDTQGYVYQIEDTLVTPIKLGSLLVSKIFCNTKLTVMYSKEEISAKMKHSVKRHPNVKQPGFKVVSYPKIDGVDLHSGLLSDLHTGLPNKRTVGTQTCVPSPNFKEPETKSHQSIKRKEPMVSFDKCKTDERFEFFTGTNERDFEALYALIDEQKCVRHLKLNYALSTPKKLKGSVLSGKDRLFMFLLRLRRGLPLEELSFIFDLSVSYVGEICYVLTRTVYETFLGMEPEMFPSAADQKKGKPKVMQPFKNLRVILDGVSFYVQRPSNFRQQGNTFSKYKHSNVMLFTIGVSCTGATVFCSKGFEGCASDKQVVVESGLLQYLNKGDGVMTDRGYKIRAEVQAVGAQLFDPSSLGDRNALTPEEEILTKALASARIYSEHAIAEIKDNRLLQGTIPLTLYPVLPQLVYVAAYLRNFKPSRIKDYSVKPTEMEPTYAPDLELQDEDVDDVFQDIL